MGVSVGVSVGQCVEQVEEGVAEGVVDGLAEGAAERVEGEAVVTGASVGSVVGDTDGRLVKVDVAGASDEFPTTASSAVAGAVSFPVSRTNAESVREVSTKLGFRDGSSAGTALIAR